jgi:diketogulonate reductase-like aldo/keto reductase
LKTSYLDLILIHWPGVKGLQLDDHKNVEMRKKTWQTLEQFYFERKVRLIGVSNYTIKHLKQLLEYCQVKPHVLQVNILFSYWLDLFQKFCNNYKSEFHPLLVQADLVEFCRSNSIQFQAYSSLGTSDQNLHKDLMENEKIAEIAKKYSKSAAQILLKWALQQDIGSFKTQFSIFSDFLIQKNCLKAVIPKAVKFEHLKANIEIFDFNLNSEDIDSITKLNANRNLCWNPQTVI